MSIRNSTTSLQVHHWQDLASSLWFLESAVNCFLMITITIHQKILPCRCQHDREAEGREASKIPHKLLRLAHAPHVLSVAFRISLDVGDVWIAIVVDITIALQRQLLRLQRGICFRLQVWGRHFLRRLRTGKRIEIKWMQEGDEGVKIVGCKIETAIGRRRLVASIQGSLSKALSV